MKKPVKKQAKVMTGAQRLKEEMYANDEKRATLIASLSKEKVKARRDRIIKEIERLELRELVLQACVARNKS